MAVNPFEGIGTAFIKKLFDELDFDITEYCNAAVDVAFEYCIKEFKKACKTAGIEWKKKWEKILTDE